MGVREENRERVEAAIRAAAREQIRTVGGGALSMRAIARDVGLVSSAIYRYFPTREALLTALIIESYGSLGDALETVRGEGADRWRDAAVALRGWATERPHEFQLIYGTPIPGYAAPPETIPLAGRVAEPFFAAAGIETADQPDAAGVLAALAELIGLLTLEFGGHFAGVTDPAELYAYAVERQAGELPRELSA
ncbi:TetR/AcrR family transcriptional regulator [Nigerium massiliense]|uniref:TetR/AcrR family transcriptional regulator n=1 Tax=Nigerium massiliense TaxID=1522317 RepID=UPI00058F6FFA|nr:TetR/AcrR family transcriptional regulator [Nigerium massiliense]